MNSAPPSEDPPHQGAHPLAHPASGDALHLTPALPPEPAARRLRQYAALFVSAALVVVFAVWLIWAYVGQRHESEANAEAANQLCRQLLNRGEACAAQPAADGVATQAAVPAPTAGLTGSALPGTRSAGGAAPTDEQGVPLAFQPGEDALIVAVGVTEGRLVLTFDDGARLDAGPVNEQLLSIVLRQATSVSPSPSPSASPSPSPVPVETVGDAPDPTDTAPPGPSSEETP